MNPISQEQVIAAYQRAPEAVREVFNSDVTANIVIEMKTKYRMHVDTAGKLGAEIGYMLLGLRSPAEFFGNLMLTGSDETTAKAIMEEVNSRIFLPLRNRVRTEGNIAPTMSYQAPVPETAPAEPLVQTPTLEYVPPATTLPGSPVPAPMPFPQATSTTADTASMPSTDASAIAPTAQAVPLHREYGADPYRESI